MRYFAIIALCLALCLQGQFAMADEGPRYRLLETPSFLKNQAIELRHYEESLIASVMVRSDSWRGAANRAFDPLAGYIFGLNNRSEKIGMTSPVATTKTQAPDGEAVWQVRFFMPTRYQLETLPMPAEGYISLESLPETDFAAIRFSGPASGAAAQANFAKHEAQLRQALTQQDISIISEAHYAVYNGPWTPPMLRRNEVLIAIKRAKQ